MLLSHVACPRWSIFVLACLVSLPCSALGVPAPPDTEPPSRPETIRKALEQTINLETSQETLVDALDHLRDQTKVNFIVDSVTIQEMGLVEPTEPVTLSLHNFKARLALRRLLAPYRLGYVILGDSVLVTTEEMAIYRQVRQRVSVDYQQIPLATALKQLARDTGTNLVLDTRATKEGQSPVTVELDDVPLEVAVRLMAEMAGLKPARVGNVLFVTTKSNADVLRAEPDAVPPQPAGIGTPGEDRPVQRLRTGPGPAAAAAEILKRDPVLPPDPPAPSPAPPSADDK